jgi:hypothetical protein
MSSRDVPNGFLVSKRQARTLVADRFGMSASIHQPRFASWPCRCLLIGYALLIFTVPRIEFHEDDTIFYLNQAHDLLSGIAIRNHYYPPGYACVLAFAHVDLGHPWFPVVIINLLSLGVGLFATAKLVPKEACALSLFSWLFISFAPRALPELLFFCLSAWCLVFAHRRQVIPMIVFSLLAVSVRSVGVALVPVVLFTMTKNAKWTAIICLVGVVLGLAFRGQLMSPTYSTALTETLRHPFSTIGKTVLWRIREIGEVLQNASATAFEPQEQNIGLHLESSFLDSEIRALSYLAGIVGLVMFCKRRADLVTLYLSGYFFILLLYPFGTSRFMVPVVPYILAHVKLSRAYVLLFCLLGFVVMGHELLITFRGQSNFDEMLSGFHLIFPD